ncbi:hypothetical protein Y032_0025g1272 [Ancylostoma ceylanicum]|uniref:SCP domain-containing protein n=1 Tax=Ancylostoma ceylanicum TaxID=53326 RepID=A0A016UW70_9BILA|nr:hypothetical protein Y032_0025g1272 [Ancylostoma ceylanicum]
MSAPTVLFACVLCFLSATCSAETAVEWVDRLTTQCWNTLGEKALSSRNVKRLLFVDVLLTKHMSMQYTCDLEEKTYDLLQKISKENVPENVVYSEGTKLHLHNVVEGWKDRLIKMPKKKFGCNMLYKINSYKIACMFE